MKQSRRMAGFGIIELMITLALGVIILLGVTEIATQNSITRNELERTGRQIQNATFAFGLLENDITNAAFWGERGEVPASDIPPLCPATAAELEDAMGFPIQGGQLDAPCDFKTGTDTIEPKANTEYIAIRRASSCALGTPGCDPAETDTGAGNNFHLQVHACFVEDSADKPGDSFKIAADVTTSTLDYLERDCITQAPVYRYINRIYYVNDDDELVRAELERNQYKQVKLVQNVELMRFEYALDENRDGQIDNYARNIADPNDPVWDDVAAVRIALIVRNSEPSAGFTDDRTYSFAGFNYTVPVDLRDTRRKLYVRTVGARNIAGRREVP